MVVEALGLRKYDKSTKNLNILKSCRLSCAPLFLKRLLDIIVSFAVLLIVWPILLAIATAIKLNSPGPVFYRGIRSGLHGSTFRILKFRTMVVNAESLGGPTTGTNDPRVTRVGALLRRTKLDEFPQFINVFCGDMSLVGPRPEVPEYTSQYSGDELLILTMRPGITDYASIEFADLDDLVGSDDPDAFFREHILPRKNELRVAYVKNWSFMEDINILWRTFMRVVKRICKR
jgi:lipopolysaccharide/colanic/teichoic acid biosynthesis glycosyltransferase